MSVTDDLSSYALSLTFDKLPTNVVERAKWILIDTLACLIGGLESDTGKICRAVAVEMGGPAEATIIGTSNKVSCSGAIMANQAMLRYLDYNDCINVYRGPGDLVSSHCSGSLPVAMAVAEQTNASGRQFLEAMIAGYEVIGRLLDSMRVSLEVRGFHHSAVAPYAGAAMAGRLLCLDESQLANAMGIAGSMTLALNILDTDGEQNVMARNIVDGIAADRGVVAARLARKGLTGPENVIEGKRGFAEMVLGSRDKFVKYSETGRFFILDTEIKGICADSTTFGYVSAAAAIVRDNNIAVADIQTIDVHANSRSVLHCGDPIKKYPLNKESADHSAYFLVAIGILDGRVAPQAFRQERYNDPVVVELIKKVNLIADARFALTAPACEVVIKTKSGHLFSKQISRSELKGLPENPMTHDDIRAKFIECADGLMMTSQIDDAIAACLDIDQMPRFRDLMSVLKVRPQYAN